MARSSHSSDPTTSFPHSSVASFTPPGPPPPPPPPPTSPPQTTPPHQVGTSPVCLSHVLSQGLSHKFGKLAAVAPHSFLFFSCLGLLAFQRCWLDSSDFADNAVVSAFPLILYGLNLSPFYKVPSSADLLAPFFRPRLKKENMSSIHGRTKSLHPLGVGRVLSINSPFVF